MKPKTVILLVVAVGCGLGASYLTSRLLAERGNQQQGEETVPVLVAKVRVAPWQPIKEPEKMFEIKQFPISVAPKNAIGELAEIKDQRFSKVIDEGKPVSKDDLLNKDQAGLAAKLQAGQRAIAIKVNAETTGGGFVIQGSRVDVMHTERGQDSHSKVLLQNMQVIAVDNQMNSNPDSPSIIGQTVTLAATPEEAARLSLAASTGELRLLIRSLGDDKKIRHIIARKDDLSKPLPKTREPGETEISPPTTTETVPLPPVVKETPKEETPKDKPQPAQPRKPRIHTLTIHSGGNVVKAKFNLDTKKGEDDDEDDSPSSVESTGGPESKKGDVKQPEVKKESPKPQQPKPAQPQSKGTFPKSNRTSRIN